MLKRVFAVFAAAVVLLLNVNSVMASSSENWKAEDADLTAIKHIVVRQPIYTVSGDAQITAEDIQNMVSEQGQRMKIDTFTEKVAERAIASSTNIDLAAMREADKTKAEEVFMRELPKQADAYMKVTVIHNRHVVLFFDIYSAATQKRVFGSQVVASKNMEDNMQTYELMTKRFYREFLGEVEAQQKAKAK